MAADTEYEILVAGENSVFYLPLQDVDGSSPENISVETPPAITVTASAFEQATGLDELENSISMDGSIGDGLLFDGLPTDFFKTDGLLEFWLKVDSWSSTGYCSILAIEDAAGNSASRIQLQRVTGVNEIRLGVGGNFTAGFPITLGEWMHVELSRLTTLYLRINGRKVLTLADGTYGVYTKIKLAGKYSTVSFAGGMAHIAAFTGAVIQGTRARTLFGLGSSNGLSAYEKALLYSYPRCYFACRPADLTGNIVKMLHSDETYNLGGSPTFSQVDPLGGTQAIRLPVDGDHFYYFVPTSFTLDYKPQSIAGWIKINAWDDVDGVVLSLWYDANDFVNSNCVQLRRDGSSGNLEIAGRNDVSAAKYTPTLGEWAYYVLTADLLTDTVQLHVNGVTVINEVVNIESISLAYRGIGTNVAGKHVDLSFAYLTDYLGLMDEATALSLYQAAVGDLVSLSIPIIWEKETVKRYIPVNWDGYELKSLSIPVAWEKETVSLNIPVRWQVTETVSLSIPVVWEAPYLSGYPVASEIWSVYVNINGVDFSARLTGQAAVELQLNNSTLADFTIIHEPGLFDQMSYMNKPVLMQSIDAAGTLSVFSGVVINAEFHPEDGVIDFTCSNDLPGYFNNQDLSAIENIVGGYHSPHIFKPESVGWSYCLDRLLTTMTGVYLDANGQPRVVSLEAAGSPDWVFNQGNIYSGSIGPLTRASRTDLVNRIRLTIEYRYTRFRQRHLNYIISHNVSACEYVQNQHGLPNRAELEGVLEKAGWTVLNKQYLNIKSGSYTCGGVYVLFNNDKYDTGFTDARLTIGKRFAQTITERYVIDVRADDSIEYAGEIGIEQNFAVTRECDASSWENSRFNSIIDGAVKDDSGDYVYDIIDADNHRANVFDVAVICGISAAVNTIKKSHRLNDLPYEVPFHPGVQLGDTVQVDTYGADTISVIDKIRHVFDFDSGDSFTEITPAISAHGGSGLVTDTSLGAIAAPEIEITEFQTGYEFGYHVGGDPSSQNDDGSLTGVLVNRKEVSGVYPVYQEQVRITLPAIAPEHHDPLTITKNSRIDVAIKDDGLTLTA